MVKCKCGGMVTDCLGELEDHNNPCVCKDLEIQALKEDRDGAIEMMKTAIEGSNELHSKVEKAHEETQALKERNERLTGYVAHRPHCNLAGVRYDCTCGLNELLKEASHG